METDNVIHHTVKVGRHILPTEGGMDYSHFIFPLKDLDKRVSDLEDANSPCRRRPIPRKLVACAIIVGAVSGLASNIWLKF